MAPVFRASTAIMRENSLTCPSRPATLILVGDGPDRADAMNLACQLGVHDKIHYAGEQQNVKQFFVIADLFLFPSDGESFGLAAAVASSIGSSPSRTISRPSISVRSFCNEGVTRSINP